VAGAIVVFGATGYTGRLTSEALVRGGVRPVLAGRSRGRLEQLADELGGRLETRVADVETPESLRALVSRGDVLVSTVGPFLRRGRPAVEAAIAAGAHYLDSCGEGAFIREVFERLGPQAEAAGVALLTAFGYDYVPGNLAGTLAVRAAGPAATRVEVGYFLAPGLGAGRRRSLTGGGRASAGTRAAFIGGFTAAGFAWRDGRIVTDPARRHLGRFRVGDQRLAGLSTGASEHFTLPRAFPQLREVGVYLGWFGALTRAVQAASIAGTLVWRRPESPRLLERLAGRVPRSGDGPSATEREAVGSLVCAAAYDSAGVRLSQAVLRGVNPYTFTGEILAWGARRLSEGAVDRAGAVGPVDAFGVDDIAAGCATAGLRPDT
jgi:short subunit dehydrogenase-like uncharacterized protein